MTDSYLDWDGEYPSYSPILPGKYLVTIILFHVLESAYNITSALYKALRYGKCR
jgi:hypothetical protein